MSTHNFDSRLVSFTNPASFAAEQYQGLRLTIERLSGTVGAEVVDVGSSRQSPDVPIEAPPAAPPALRDHREEVTP